MLIPDISSLILDSMTMDQLFRVAIALRRLPLRDECIRRSSSMSPDSASANGQISLLQWWKDNGMATYSRRSMDHASAQGHIVVLEWWIASGLECKYSHRAMDWASHAGLVNVLDWWQSCPLQCVYSHDSIDLASARAHIHVLTWWLHYYGEHGILFSSNAFTWAKLYQHKKVYKWLKCRQRHVSVQ